jgi:hypothetical protein
MKLFEVRLVDNQKYILIPSNLGELAERNYLFALFSKALQTLDKVYLPLLGGAYKDNMPVTKESELFLNGFGCPLLLGKVGPFEPEMKGSFKKGYFCILKYLTATYKHLDTRILRFGASHHAVQELFGEAWATNRENEKIILDLILTATKAYCKEWHWINSYIIPKEELIKKFGLKTNKHLAKVLSEVEQEALSTDFIGYFKSVEDLRVPEFAEVNDYILFQKQLENLCRTSKKYKALIKTIVDQRMKILYAGNKQEKARKAKVPVKDLVTKAKGTREYVNSFAPNEALRLPKFVLAKYPETDEDMRALGIQLTTWATSLDKRLDKGRIEICKNWILAESSS